MSIIHAFLRAMSKSLLSYMDNLKENPPAILSSSFYVDVLSNTKLNTSLVWNQYYQTTSTLFRSMSTSLLLYTKNLKENPPAILSATFYADVLSNTKSHNIIDVEFILPTNKYSPKIHININAVVYTKLEGKSSSNIISIILC